MKCCAMLHSNMSLKSPPSRGAWIEINLGVKFGLDFAVAPLAGGVD